MYAYRADTLRFQPGRQLHLEAITSWIKRRTAAWRTAIARHPKVAHLRTLDRHVLADMGIAADSLGQSHPSLAQFNPHAVAIDIFRPRY